MVVPTPSAYLIDGMSLIQKLKVDHLTFGEIAEMALSSHCLTLVPEANKPDTKPKRNVLALVVETLDSAQNPPDKSLSRG